jgi:hypothetical protein
MPSGAFVAELYDNLAECLSDSAKASDDRAFYEVQTEEAAILKSMAREAEAMDFDAALSFLLKTEPVCRRDALFRLGMQAGVLTFLRVEDEKEAYGN